MTTKKKAKKPKPQEPKLSQDEARDRIVRHFTSKTTKPFEG